GSDEFGVIFFDELQAGDLTQITEQLMREMSVPFVIYDHEIVVTMSIGIAMYPYDGEMPDKLILNADAALTFAKDSGRNNYQFYSNNIFSIILSEK
ncbi:MAG: GGDEF domain-containing protein, partial [Proteobacteria bacterium]|nr:GGDEF domain-containing protein [Pseudomonadota bacterium]